MTIVIRLVFALLGALGAVQVAAQTDFTDSYSSSSRYLVWVAIVLGGAFAGWLIGVILGSAAARAIRKVETAASNRSPSELLVGGIGLLLGFAIAALLSLPILRLPYVGGYLLLLVFLLLGYVFAIVAARNSRSLLRLVGINAARFESAPGERRRPELNGAKLVDTSAIIDGRISDIVETGFLDGELIIPVFVLEELQKVADSSATRSAAPAAGAASRWCTTCGSARARSRRRTSTTATCRTSTRSCCGWPRSATCPILTTDYNLNKVARIQGVTVLNVNELANALKPAVLPGESLRVKVIREGKEQEQGVGYLDDGTMIVVEGGRSLRRRRRSTSRSRASCRARPAR